MCANNEGEWGDAEDLKEWEVLKFGTSLRPPPHPNWNIPPHPSYFLLPS